MKNIYILPTQHFDLVWRRSRGYYRSVRTAVLKKTLEIIKEHADYRFYMDQAEVADEFITYNPVFADEFSEALKTGRIVVCGGGWSLADANLISGEAIVRNLLYGRQWFWERFGVTVTSGSYVDTFGMCGQLPQIMKLLGDDSCIPGRTPGGEGRYQFGNYGCFLWEGIDGTQVVSGVGAMGKMSYEGMSGFDGYGVLEGQDELYLREGNNPELARKNIEAGLRDMAAMEGNLFFTEYTGEEHIPSAVLCELAEKMNRESGDCRFHISTPDVFFSRVDRDALPVIQGEFNPTLTGCYTTRIRLKQGLRKAENALLSEESLLALTRMLRGTWLKNRLKEAWRGLSYAAFHDAVCGCHIDETGEEIAEILNRVTDVCEERFDAAREIAGALTAPPGSYVVFNTLGFPRKETVVIPGVHSVRIVDEYGKTVPSADGEEGVTFIGELPAMGYRCYRAEKPAGAPRAKRAETDCFCTRRYEVRVGETRLFVYDKLLGQRLDTDEMPLGHLVFAEDSGNLWVERITDQQTDESAGMSQLLSTEENDVFFCVTYSGSMEPQDAEKGKWDGAEPLRWEKKYIFYREIDRIDMETRIDWSGKNSTVMAEFPCKFVSGEGKAVYDVPFGSQERAPYEADYQKNVGGSWPSLHAADFSDDVCGLTVANAGTPAYCIRDKVIRVTLLRSGSDWSVPAFPFEPEPGSFDSGSHCFRFSLTPHLGDWVDSGAFLSGAALNRTPETAEILCPGEHMPPGYSMLSISEPNIILSACKPAESGDAVALRLYEYAGRSVTTRVTFSAAVRRCVETDLTENKVIGDANLSRLTFRPYEIKTVLLYL